MKKPTTLVIWKTVEEEGHRFFPTRRAAKAYLADMVKKTDLAGDKVPAWIATQKPQKYEVQLWEGRSLMDALIEGIRIGHMHPLDLC